MYMVLIVSPVVSCALLLAQSAQMSRMLNQLGVESHYINSDLSQVCVHLKSYCWLASLHVVYVLYKVWLCKNSYTACLDIVHNSCNIYISLE